MKKRNLYIILLSLRFLFIFSYGYIHPDEFFQGPQVISKLIYDFDIFVPWEFSNLQKPIRSIFSPIIISGIPYYIFKYLGFNSNFNILLYLPRLFLFFISIFFDHLLGKTAEKLNSKNYHSIKCLYSSLWPILLCGTRTFSNTTETMLLLLFFYYLLKDENNENNFYYVGVITSIGFFTRFTYSFFVFPIFTQMLIYNFKKLFRVIIGFSIMSIILILIDSIFFKKGNFELIITPLNFLIYNFNPDNLAKHTTHPRLVKYYNYRWLHLVVNTPLIFGPIVFYLSHKIFFNFKFIFSFKNSKLIFSSILSGLLLLSYAPHQEPRFLFPLVIPFILMISFEKIWLKKIFIISITFGLIASLFFSQFHQAGVLKTLKEFENVNNKTIIIFTHTYMVKFIS
jgi:phosphatidylinositol glycan class Z